MLPSMRSIAGTVAFAALLVPLCGCAALRPDRSVQSIMTLAPGQSVAGQFEIPDGSRGLVRFQRGEPTKGVAPYPDATTWIGDGKVTIAFPDMAASSEGPLGYAQIWLEDGRVCRVVVRNADARPVTFGWSVKGPSDAVANWDLSGVR